MFIRRRLLQVLSFIIILTMMFSALQLPSVSAQGNDGIERRHNAQTGKVSFIGPQSGRSVSAAKALGITAFGRPSDPGLALAKRFAPEFGLKNPGRDLTKLKTNRSNNGRLSVRFQQNYQGIPVMGGELIVNTNAKGDLYSMNGEVSPDIAISTRPTVSANQARQTALRAIAKWHQMEPEDFRVSTPELWIYDESLLRSSTRPVELVWRMEVTAKDLRMPLRELVLVNAWRGNISLHFNQVDTSWKVGGQTGTSQDVSPTSTPAPTATPEPLATPGPTRETNKDVPAAEAGESGVTRYVAGTGNDSYECTTPAQACASIQRAINVAGANNIIKVAVGTYYYPGLALNPTPNVLIINGKNLVLSGGWAADFSVQTGVSTIDGQNLNNGILAHTNSTVVVDRFVIQNSTSSDSGGIYISGGNFTLKNSTLRDNQATNRGGGVFLIGNPTFTLINSTISGNTSASSGGGIHVDAGTVNIEYSTIAYNASTAGGGVFRSSGTLNIHNSILANNTGTTAPNCNSLSTSGYNVIGSTTNCSFIPGTSDQTGVVDPGIESMLSGTMPVHALLPGSPAIDRGELSSCTTTAESRDQRGISRPQGSGCDSGSFESIEPG
ncbi:MAG: choice-of-anchor Q domain-containing protein, partial [Anaerolineales bacterium]